MVLIRVFGTGCEKCDIAYENVKKAVEELGVNAEIVKVSDIDEISQWVFITPGIAFDDLVVFEGKTPTIEEIKEELKRYLEEEQQM